MDGYAIEWGAFLAHLESEVENARDSDAVTALVIIQIRHLSLCNYRLGFAGGEAVVGEVARRAASHLKKSAGFQRIAPDRLAGIVPDIKVTELLPVSVRKLSDALGEPYYIGGRPVSVDTAIGLALYPEHGVTGEALMSEVELSLDNDFRGRSDRFQIPSKTYSEKHLSRLQIENDLQVAIANGNLSLSYQPKVDLVTMSPVASEALIRWVRDDGESVAPDRFIHIAEATGDIDALTDWAINAALRENTRLWDDGREIAVAVNISAPSIYDPAFLITVERALDIWGLSPSFLTIEITETVLMKEREICFRHLARLRDMGVKISIDDFGTGFSSLSYFKHIPADEIKIDQSFITSISHSADDRKIVEAIIDLSHKFDLRVVAEGIEDAPTLELLRHMGCDIGQGYYLAKPMDIGGYQRWLQDFDHGRFCRH